MNNQIYKACQNSIVTMELCEDSLTNEKRKDVVDPLHAKFRTNKVKVISIVDPITDEEMKEDRSIYNHWFIYRIGQTITESNYYSNINEICAAGIHYFKTYEAALSLYYRSILSYQINGTYIGWHDNGHKKYEYNYKDGKLDGLYQIWNSNGQKEHEYNYKDGKLDGLYQRWYNNEQKSCEKNYKDGKKDGLSQGWYDNGQKFNEKNYIDGKLDGLSQGWYKNGQKFYEKNYANMH